MPRQHLLTNVSNINLNAMSKWLGGQNSNGGFVAFFIYIPVMPYVSQEVLNYLESCLLLRHKLQSHKFDEKQSII